MLLKLKTRRMAPLWEKVSLTFMQASVARLCVLRMRCVCFPGVCNSREQGGKPDTVCPLASGVILSLRRARTDQNYSLWEGEHQEPEITGHLQPSCHIALNQEPTFRLG